MLRNDALIIFEIAIHDKITMQTGLTITIRPFHPGDFPSVKEIYRQGIETKNATFEPVAPGWTRWDKKFMPWPRLVAVSGKEVAGWAALMAVSSRAVYAGVGEISIYVHSGHRSKGIGYQLLKELISASEQNNIWTLQAGIFPENSASLKMHKALGFREVGYREKIGKMDGKWRNVILLERRSSIAGTD